MLGLLLVGLRAVHAWLWGDVLEKPGVGVVDELLVRLCVSADFFLGYVCRLGVIGGDDGTLALEFGLVEQLEVTAGLVDAGGHQDGVTSLARQAIFQGIVEDDIGHDAVHPCLGAEHALQGSPLALELPLLPGIQS